MSGWPGARVEQRRWGRYAGRAMLPCHGAILLLWLLHAHLMATGRCAALMAPGHGAAAQGMDSPHPGMSAAPPTAAAQHRWASPPVPASPHVCPAQQAVPLLLALALALMAALLSGGDAARVPAASLPGQGLGEPARPPPLSARRRRALLQVFLN